MLTERRELYVVNGVELPGKSHAKLVPPSEVAFFARSSSSVIPASYFVATAQHESSFAANEIDYEVPNEHGVVYVSKGLYQLSDEEAESIGMRGANLFDPVMATIVFAKLQEIRLTALEKHGSVRPDVWGYMAVAHNEGLKAALKTIELHGMKWGNPGVRAELDAQDTYRFRNRSRKIVAYGDDCITGGRSWTGTAS